MATLNPTASTLSFYNLLRRLPLGHSYVLRLFLICFLATHVPLIVLLTRFLSDGNTPFATHADILVPLLVATVTGTVLCLVGLHHALAPLMRSAEALREYTATRTLPDLPLDGNDEAGELMATVRVVCERLETELRRREHQASTDPLTGLANRLGFFDRAIGLLNEARRARTPTALILFDIDHFKSVNDTWGHPAGDSVIGGVARVIATASGGKAACGRLGGEEFAIVLPDATLEEARIFADRVREDVAALAFAQLEGRQITVSGGVSPIDALSEADLGPALERADHLLYAAKENGRNRVH